MNIASLAVLVLVFLGGICILAGYMLTNALHRFRSYCNNRKQKEDTA